MIRIVPFEIGHLARIEPPVLSVRQVREASLPASVAGPAFSAIDERGAVIGCAGLVIDGEAGVAWAVLTDEVRSRPLFLHRNVKRGLAAIVKRYGLARVEATARADWAGARSWLRRLGFRPSGIESDYMGTGQTYMRYVK